MEKKNFLIILSIALLVFISVIGIYYFRKVNNKIIKPNSQIFPTITDIPEELVIWDDVAQFSFQYPKSLTLDKHDEDKENYAHVEISSLNYPGHIIVWVKDTKSVDIEDWVKKSRLEGTIDTTLGDEKAKKILTDSPNKKITTSAIHNGYLYEIEADIASPYWNKVYDIVLANFKFTTNSDELSTQDKSIDSSDESSSYEEEIIE